MIGIWQRKPIDWLVAIVTRVCSYRQANLCSGASHLGHVLDVSNDHVRTGHKVSALRADCVSHAGMTIELSLTINRASISIGCIATPTEIVPTFRPALRWSADRIGKLL